MSNKNSLKVVVNSYSLCTPGYVVSPESKLSVPSYSLKASDEADAECVTSLSLVSSGL